MSDLRQREVVYDARWDAEAQAVEENVQRLDEAMRYFEFQLSRAPKSGIESPAAGIWVAHATLPTRTNRQVRVSVFYSFDEEQVRMRSIRLAQ